MSCGWIHCGPSSSNHGYSAQPQSVSPVGTAIDGLGDSAHTIEADEGRAALRAVGAGAATAVDACLAVAVEAGVAAGRRRAAVGGAHDAAAVGTAGAGRAVGVLLAHRRRG